MARTARRSGTDPGRGRPSKLDPYKGIIDARLADYPKLSAGRLFDEVQAAGYPGVERRPLSGYAGITGELS